MVAFLAAVPGLISIAGKLALWGGGLGIANHMSGGAFFNGMKESFSAITGGEGGEIKDQKVSNLYNLAKNLEAQNKDVHIDQATMSVSAVDRTTGNMDFYVFTSNSIHKVHGAGSYKDGNVGFTPTMPDYQFDINSPIESSLRDIRNNTWSRPGNEIKGGSKAVHAMLVDKNGNPTLDKEDNKYARLGYDVDNMQNLVAQHFRDKKEYQETLVRGLTSDLNAFAKQSNVTVIPKENIQKVEAQINAFTQQTGLALEPGLTLDQKLAGVANFVTTVGLSKDQYKSLGSEFQSVVKTHYKDANFTDINANLTGSGGLKNVGAASFAAPAATQPLVQPQAQAQVQQPQATPPAGNANAGNEEEKGGNILSKLSNLSPGMKMIVGVILTFAAPLLGLLGSIPGMKGIAGMAASAGKLGGMGLAIQGGGEMMGADPIGWIKDQAKDLGKEIKDTPSTPKGTPQQPEQPKNPAQPDMLYPSVTSISKPLQPPLSGRAGFTPPKSTEPQIS